MDIRNGLSLVNQLSAHENAIKCLALNTETNTLLSGSTKGDIKVWDMNGLTNTEVLPKEYIHMPARFQDMHNQYSVIDMTVSDGVLYSSWDDGTLRRSSKKL
jgi:WD40 repeat protein